MSAPINPYLSSNPGILASHSPLLNERRAAEFLGVSHRTLQGWRQTGGGPRYSKIGRLVKYRHADLIEYTESRLRSHTSQGE